MADLLKIAEVLERTADLVESDAAEKTAALTHTRNAKANDLAEKYASATGEELPRDVAEKLAAGDASVLKTVEKIVEKAAAVESLGRSSERPDDEGSRPVTKTERAKAAWERMGRFLSQ